MLKPFNNQCHLLDIDESNLGVTQTQPSILFKLEKTSSFILI